MPKAIVHPHPSHPFRCGDCKHWHPAYVGMFVIDGAGNMMPTKEAVRQAIPNLDKLISDRRSMCILDPKWELTGEDHYCSHFEAAKVY